MITDGVFRDYFDAGTTLDENTFITDYWLDFVAVRDEVAEPRQNDRSATQELYEKVQDFEHRIEVLLEDQRRIRVQFDQFIPKERSPDPTSYSSGLKKKTASSKSNQIPNTRANRSLAELFRRTLLYTAIQKLR